MLPEVFWVVPTPVWHVDQSPPMFETIRWRSSITWLLAYFLALLTLTVMYASQCMLVLCPYNLLKAIEWKISSFVENTCWTLLKNHFDTLPDIMQKQSYDLLMSIFFSMSCIYFYFKNDLMFTELFKTYKHGRGYFSRHRVCVSIRCTDLHNLFMLSHLLISCLYPTDIGIVTNGL